MLKNKFPYLLLLFFLPFTSFVNAPSNPDHIPWSAERKLGWNDYLANPVIHTDAVALTATHLGMDMSMKNNKVAFHITCSFVKSKSWGKVKTPYILAHEQGHFDIAEIYARELYKRLQEYRFNSKTYQADLQKIYKGVVEEKESFQTRYDRETNHSIIRDKQMEWLDTIEDRLKKSEKFSSYH